MNWLWSDWQRPFELKCRCLTLDDGSSAGRVDRRDLTGGSSPRLGVSTRNVAVDVVIVDEELKCPGPPPRYRFRCRHRIVARDIAGQPITKGNTRPWSWRRFQATGLLPVREGLNLVSCWPRSPDRAAGDRRCTRSRAAAPYRPCIGRWQAGKFGRPLGNSSNNRRRTMLRCRSRGSGSLCTPAHSPPICRADIANRYGSIDGSRSSRPR